jgi:uncharacterized membrane protein YhaH (DUF805 family)
MCRVQMLERKEYWVFSLFNIKVIALDIVLSNWYQHTQTIFSSVFDKMEMVNTKLRNVENTIKSTASGKSSKLYECILING